MEKKTKLIIISVIFVLTVLGIVLGIALSPKTKTTFGDVSSSTNVVNNILDENSTEKILIETKLLLSNVNARVEDLNTELNKPDDIVDKNNVKQKLQELITLVKNSIDTYKNNLELIKSASTLTNNQIKSLESFVDETVLTSDYITKNVDELYNKYNSDLVSIINELNVAITDINNTSYDDLDILRTKVQNLINLTYKLIDTFNRNLIIIKQSIQALSKVATNLIDKVNVNIETTNTKLNEITTKQNTLSSELLSLSEKVNTLNQSIPSDLNLNTILTNSLKIKLGNNENQTWQIITDENNNLCFVKPNDTVPFACIDPATTQLKQTSS